MPSLDSERPFDRWNTDLNAFAVGGVADGDWPSGGLERVCKHRNACVFLIERRRLESVDGRTVAQPNAPTVYVTEIGRRVDNNRYSVMVPASRLVNVDVREKYPRFGLFCWTVGWWEVFSRVGRTARSAIGRSECR